VTKKQRTRYTFKLLLITGNNLDEAKQQLAANFKRVEKKDKYIYTKLLYAYIIVKNWNNRISLEELPL